MRFSFQRLFQPPALPMGRRCPRTTTTLVGCILAMKIQPQFFGRVFVTRSNFRPLWTASRPSWKRKYRREENIKKYLRDLPLPDFQPRQCDCADGTLYHSLNLLQPNSEESSCRRSASRPRLVRAVQSKSLRFTRLQRECAFWPWVISRCPRYFASDCLKDWEA